jgi:hypothetical protein
MTEIAAIVFGVLALVASLLPIRLWQQIRRLNVKYQPMIDAEERVRQAEQKLEDEQQRQKALIADTERRVTKLDIQYQDELAKFNILQKEVSTLEENLEDISFGLYKPHFSFQISEEYKVAIDNLRDQERQTWNNISKMQERVRKAFESLNDLDGVTQVSITPEYLKLRLDELRLAYEYDEKRHQEREEQRRFREQIREEEKAQKELERAREEAERQEADYEKALAKAREEALRATGTQLQELTERVKSFEAKLDDSEEKGTRNFAGAID